MEREILKLRALSHIKVPTSLKEHSIEYLQTLETIKNKNIFNTSLRKNVTYNLYLFSSLNLLNSFTVEYWKSLWSFKYLLFACSLV